MRSCVLFLFAAVTFAQSTANIVGTVRDSTDAAVPGARVTAVNVQTGLRLTRESLGDGSYSIPLVPAGQYRLEVEKDGFQRYARSGITPPSVITRRSTSRSRSARWPNPSP